jgi:hypothetical protein
MLQWGGRLTGTDTQTRRRRNKVNRAKRAQRRTGRAQRIPGSRKGYGYSLHKPMEETHHVI